MLVALALGGMGKPAHQCQRSWQGRLRSLPGEALEPGRRGRHCRCLEGQARDHRRSRRAQGGARDADGVRRPSPGSTRRCPAASDASGGRRWRTQGHALSRRRGATARRSYPRALEGRPCADGRGRGPRRRESAPGTARRGHSPRRREAPEHPEGGKGPRAQCAGGSGGHAHRSRARDGRGNPPRLRGAPPRYAAPELPGARARQVQRRTPGGRWGLKCWPRSWTSGSPSPAIPGQPWLDPGGIAASRPGGSRRSWRSPRRWTDPDAAWLAASAARFLNLRADGRDATSERVQRVRRTYLAEALRGTWAPAAIVSAAIGGPARARGSKEANRWARKLGSPEVKAFDRADELRACEPRWLVSG